MEVKKYNPVVVIRPKPKAKPLTKAKIKATGSNRERSSKPKTELEAKGLTLDNKKKLDTIYAKGFVKTISKKFDYH